QFLEKETAAFYVVFYATVAVFIASWLRSGRGALGSGDNRRLALFALLAILMLFVSFLRSHYWKHYSVLLVPFFVILLMLMLQHGVAVLRGRPRVLQAALVAGVLLLIAPG